MTKKLSKKEEEKIITKALERYKYELNAFDVNRKNFEADCRFVFKSDQWPANIKSNREKKNRPCLTVNKLKKFVKRVAGEIRQNLPTIKFRPVDSAGDIVIAEILEDIKRTIDSDPEAKMAYKTAFEYAVGGGFGFYRLITE